MTDVMSLLRTLCRPRLLVDAATCGVPLYRRETHLARLLQQTALPGPQQAAVELFSLEQSHEEARQSGSANYSPVRHVEVLVALMAEARDVLARSEAAEPRAQLRLV